MNGRIKKELTHFIKDETGKVSKDKILKLGIGTMSAMAIMNTMMAPDSYAAHTNSAFSDSPTAACNVAHTSHSSY